MSLRPQTVPPVPEETVRIARLAFPKGNLYMQIRDEIGILLTDADFTDLFPSRGKAAYAPWRLALITIFQFIENLSDREAAESVRARIDWEQKKAICPAGKENLSWLEAKTETAKRVVKIKFSTKDCRVCLFRGDCTKSKIARRTLTILPEEQFEMQRAARQREKTWEYKRQYQRRSGVEGTISQSVRGFGMRHSRYIGAAKTQLQNLMTATAVNFVRLNNWFNEVPIAQTRQPLFARVIRRARTAQ